MSTMALSVASRAVLDVCDRLGLGERTLQRRLEALGIGYADVLAEVRAERACDYLREPGISLAEIAWLLGFSEQSAFTRAFKRWHGRTPGAWRAALGPSG
ncbi:MAG: helix-turn-helix transcriptional regulator [Myxococcales bacterium]|nr:helix-turn-helix transcriptional regulator [Myxococcales bacterium]